MVPQGVTLAMTGRRVTAKGKLGELSLDVSDEVDARVEDGRFVVQPRGQTKQARSTWGTTRALVSNMVRGVSVGFQRRLEINGVGYRAAVAGQTLTLQLGYSHDIVYEVPAGVKIVAEKPTLLVVSGADKRLVGQVSAEIRAYRGPEPYKGKGVKYEDEKIVRKEGKKK
jgi:large subunit ribosomal protein L6